MNTGIIGNWKNITAVEESARIDAVVKDKIDGSGLTMVMSRGMRGTGYNIRIQEVQQRCRSPYCIPFRGIDTSVVPFVS